ncbi:hypothetical protein D6C95_01993 [Aureobasidium pullulans]|nr:hypothetical protein D6C95_01993 [Aureobasidium pullulans]
MTGVVYSKFPHEKLRSIQQSDSHKPLTLEYIAEGNANIVYTFKPIADEPVNLGVRRKLLRLRKDKSFIQSTQSQYITFQREFLPLFRPENIVEQTLITLDESLIESLNQRLAEHESTGARKDVRHGDRLAVDDHGLLMTDMTAQHGEFLFEIKPKWLQQSPDAPRDSIRCRTCALRVQRDHMKAGGAVIPTRGGFCPLGLIDVDIEERRRAFRNIIEAQANELSHTTVGEIVNYLAEEGYQVLSDLRKHQAQFDKHGLLGRDPEDISDDYSKAMTLRDCMLFVKGSLNAFANTADIRLADLDFKHAHPDKVQKWKTTERTLVDQGWYTSTEVDEGAAGT